MDKSYLHQAWRFDGRSRVCFVRSIFGLPGSTGLCISSGFLSFIWIPPTAVYKDHSPPYHFHLYKRAPLDLETTWTERGSRFFKFSHITNVNEFGNALPISTWIPLITIQHMEC